MKMRWGKTYKSQIDETIDARGYMIDKNGKCFPKSATESEG